MVTGLTLLGVGVIGSYREAVLRWLEAEWTRGPFVLMLILFAAALFALYAVEKEADSRRFVQLSVSNLEATFYPVLHCNEGDRHNVLAVNVGVSFRNDTEKPTRAFFPLIEIGKRTGKKSWQPLELEIIESSGEIYPRGRIDGLELWFDDQRFEIPALDHTKANFRIEGVVPPESLGYSKQDLSLRMKIDVVGSEVVTIERQLPPIVES